jgi:hypothetical protein
MLFFVGSATTTYRMQYREGMLVVMYGDLPEDFRDMCDRRKSYNHPLDMKRSEMGEIVCRVQREKEGPTRAPAKAGLFSQDQKGEGCQG